MRVKIKTPSQAEIQREMKRAFQELERKGLNALSKSELDFLGNQVRSKVVQVISQGQSPITGWPSRFPGYKNPEKYIKSVKSNFPNKKARPVNLKLSGEFLDSLYIKGLKRGDENYLNVGFNGFENELKELGHREGVNGQPKRPIVPSESGEDYIAPIRRFLSEAFKTILQATLAKIFK